MKSKDSKRFANTSYVVSLPGHWLALCLHSSSEQKTDSRLTPIPPGKTPPLGNTDDVSKVNN